YPLSGTGSVSDADLINNNLRVHLPVAGTRNWDYAVYDSGCVQVTRRNDFTRKWYLAITSFTPTSIIPCN
ncbi:MAG: hypothetical protein NT033_01140, partial [Candidatus Omnitrophica bacterium]|nr:hypothetical protein [Candidatus Omnitrophota bacterium]